MTTTSVIVIVVVAVIFLVALVAALAIANRARQRRQLKERFGPEYERVVSSTGDQKRAEVDLRGRVEERDKINVKPLGPAQRDRYQQDWRQVQAAFVDVPSTALAQADSLITNVMVERGYPMRDFDSQADLLSVDHPQVVQHYRQAHGTYVNSQRGPVPTEEMRQAFVSFRALFAELVEDDDEAAAHAGPRTLPAN